MHRAEHSRAIVAQQCTRATRENSSASRPLCMCVVCVAEVEHQPVGRLDGRDARRRDRVRVRAPAERQSHVQGGGARARPQDDTGLLQFRRARVSLGLRPSLYYTHMHSSFFLFVVA